MRISFQWLNELIDLKNVNFDFLVEKLTLGGFEVEETFEFRINEQSDIILEISSTANRSDSLSIKGIAKEIAALLNTEYRTSPYVRPFLDLNLIIQRLIEKTPSINSSVNGCSSFLMVNVQNINDHQSPNWLQQKLMASGIEPLNNLLDFQNYVTLETGYTFEFYDLEKVKSKVLQKNFTASLSYGKNEKFLGPNGTNYTITPNILALKVEDTILSIGGIIPNKEFLYSPQSKSLLIEASIFNSKKIRQISRLIGVRTERSARYEKGLNSNKLNEALWRLLTLLKVSNSTLNCQLITAAKPQQLKEKTLFLKYKTLIKTLGPVIDPNTKRLIELDADQISQYLNRLKFQFTFDKKAVIWEIKIPDERNEDITREIDVIEEIGRLHGFNNFSTSLPSVTNVGHEDLSYQMRKKLTACLIGEGLTELINYSLVADQNFQNIKIINPLVQDYSALRCSLLPNLLDTVSENFKQGNSCLEAFEYGHVFQTSTNNFFVDETEFIGGIFGGLELKTKWSNHSVYLSWFEAKGKIENIFNKLNIQIHWRNPSNQFFNEFLHPYRTSELYLSTGKRLGVFGQIHPLTAKKFTISPKSYLFEFNFETLKNEFKYQNLPVYLKYSAYPKIEKDLSFTVSREVSFEEVQNVIKIAGTNFLTSIRLLDEYRGENIPKSQTSLCVQLTFQSKSRTLVNKEIEKILDNITQILTEQFDISVRI
jgi:phenylalanyl-tRNA synthetase beta chain